MFNYDTSIDAIIATLSPHNRKIAETFVRNKRLAGVKPVTILNALRVTGPFFRYFQDANYDEITSEQIEDWYLWYCKTPTHSTNLPPKESTVLASVTAVRTFIAAMHGEDTAKQMMKRIKPRMHKRVTVKEEELLSDEEIRRMMETCTSERDRAIIAVLYSSGCRVGELCNLKIKDLILRRESASLHLNGKTGERDIDMFVGVPELKRWKQMHPFQDDEESYLFVSKLRRGMRFTPNKLDEKSIRIMLKRVAQRAGIPATKRVNPHSFRHKRATDLADHMTQADLRYMFGWTDMSTSPNVYVHSSRGKVKRKLAEIAGVRVPESVAPTNMVKQCPVCGMLNSATSKWCSNCMTTLHEPLARAEKLGDEMTVERYKMEQMEKEEK